MSYSDPDSEQRLPGSDLPPVQPPSAGFLVQLFLVPGLIVAIIVAVWVLFHWLAQAPGDPKKYAKELEHDSPDVWQKAENLAEMLRNDRAGELKGDADLAATLGKILDTRIDDAKLDEASINLRVYLSSALGQFNVPDGLPALLKAATTQRDDKELAVRRAALDAIGLLAVNVQTTTHQPLTGSDLLPTLLTASRDHEPVIRLRAAAVLGVVGGDEALARLKAMLDDPYPDVSYNAATGLARHGDPQSLDVLVEMLDPDQKRAVENVATAEEDKDADSQTEKRWYILLNGLRGLNLLADANPKADLSRAEPAVAKLHGSEFPYEVRDMALTVEKKLKDRGRK